MDGWIKLHRALLKKPIWQMSTPEQKTILVALLLMANHEENKWEWKGEPYQCKPGQFITSLENIAKECGKGVSIQNVRTALKRFEKYDFLTDISTKTGRLITIVNWGSYQVPDAEPNNDVNSHLTDDQQTPNRRLTPNKNDKNVKNDKNNIYTQIDDLYNSICVSYPRLKTLSDSRKKALSARLKTYTVDDFEKLFTMAEESKFLKGGNDRSWSATFDWLIKDSNMAKVLDGNYENKAQQPKPQTKTTNNKFNQFPQRDNSEVISSLEQKLLRR